MKILKPSTSAATAATALLKRGGIIICPTDTVYGFLADAQNKKAVEKIYKIKNRPKSKPLSLFVKDLKMAGELAEIDARQEKVVRKFWPGKYTFILKRKINTRTNLTAVKFVRVYGVKKDSIALRIPNHPFLQKLLKKIDRPLVQTSVNISAQEPLNSIADILAIFERNGLVGLIIDGGDIKSAKASKIIDFTTRNLTRLR